MAGRRGGGRIIQGEQDTCVFGHRYNACQMLVDWIAVFRMFAKQALKMTLLMCRVCPRWVGAGVSVLICHWCKCVHVN